MNTQTIGKTGTTIYTDNGYTVIRYHNTEVVKFNDNIIILNTGGWYTNTTKRRMNQASEAYNLGFQVYQKDYVFYVSRDSDKESRDLSFDNSDKLIIERKNNADK